MKANNTMMLFGVLISSFVAFELPAISLKNDTKYRFNRILLSSDVPKHKLFVGHFMIYSGASICFIRSKAGR